MTNEKQLITKLEQVINNLKTNWECDEYTIDKQRHDNGSITYNINIKIDPKNKRRYITK